ncbi:MAG: hypothetical protein WD250_13815 [Egibacteraceae bacterium]
MEHQTGSARVEARTPHGDHGGYGEPGGQAEHGGHGGHGDHAAMFRDRFWLTLVLTLPVVYYSEHLRHWFGYQVWAFPGHEWLSPVLGTAIFLYGGRPFLVGGLQEARARRPGMMLLIAMAITVAFAASWATTVGLFAVEVWWELSLLIAIMMLGHWLEMRAIGQARGALAALAELLPDEAERVGPDGEVETVAIAELAVGDVVLVRPGARVPADGTVSTGSAELDESMITGESNPVVRGEGDRVVAATVVGGSSIRVEVGAVGDDTALAGIQRLVEEAQTSTSRTQALADRAAALLFSVALVSAAVTMAGRPPWTATRTRCSARPPRSRPTASTRWPGRSSPRLVRAASRSRRRRGSAPSPAGGSRRRSGEPASPWADPPSCASRT